MSDSRNNSETKGPVYAQHIEVLERIEPCNLNSTSAKTPSVGEYELDLSLATQVREKLGYSPPGTEDVPRKTAEKAHSQLIEALTRAGIKPFEPSSVKRYKRQVRHSWLRGKRSGPIERLVQAVMLRTRLLDISDAAGSLLLFPASSIGLSIGGAVTLTQSHWSAGLGLLCGGVLFACFFGIFVKATQRGWNRLPLKNYKRPVPSFALLTALELNAHFPGVEFFVEEFEKQDPFLIAYDSKANEEAHVEVWAEPSYTAQRMK